MDHTTSLIQTKLHRPPLPVDLVPRPRLTEWLEQRRIRPLTLISAPAGYGKSTLAEYWLEYLDWPRAWVSLDEHDDDLVVFLNYFLAAIQSIFPDVGDETLALLKVSPLPPLTPISRCLINELAQIDQPFVLVLDDYHQIHEASINELLNELLLHPPHALHLLICTRLDPLLPLVKLRAQGQITEIRAQDLRFTQEETSILLQKMLGRAIDKTTVISLEKQTEGWVTGLRLAVLALRRRVGRVRIQGELTVNNRYVADYLVSEILGQVVPVHSDCMLKIAVLERFNTELCQAVCFDDQVEDKPDGGSEK
ncbi:MAG: AAA family ATPase, partial [Chloroflexota bacterium]|nr:AAA family ATPase [Chloroflexota bacterium]